VRIVDHTADVRETLLAAKASRSRRGAAERRAARQAEDYVQGLDRYEVAVLREFVIQDRNTLALPIDQPVVAGLLRKGVLVQLGSNYEHTLVGTLGAPRIRESLQDLITVELLRLAAAHPDPAELQRLRHERPSFMAYIEERDVSMSCSDSSTKRLHEARLPPLSAGVSGGCSEHGGHDGQDLR